jgi:hypothetical protein
MIDNNPDLDTLWTNAPHAGRAFDPQQVAHLPPLAQSYFTHAIAPGAPLAGAVRLRMHGSIKLRRWHRFMAVQVITRDAAMIWRASVRMRMASIRGYDQFVDGRGSMKWRLFGIVPIVLAEGADVTRSVAGRVAAESIWLPPMLLDERVRWSTDGPGVARAALTLAGHSAEVRITLDHGRLQTIGLSRWGNPDGESFRELPFGACVDQEATFGDYTIPARVRVGWYFDDPARFDAEGKFFEASIDAAVYR